MRIGGFGASFLLALPLAVAHLIRKRSVATWVACGSTLLSPDPAVSRYVLGLVAVALAFAAPSLTRLSTTGRRIAGAALGAMGLVQLLQAFPGLAGEGPPLLRYASMPDPERALAVGADGPPLTMDAARRRVGYGEAFAFDKNLDLCDLAWDSRQSYRVTYLPETLGGDALLSTFTEQRVRVLAVSDDGPTAALAEHHPELFERLGSIKDCRRGRCALYLRRD